MLYFKSEGSKIAYGLIELDGKPRFKVLGVHLQHFTNIDYADRWFDNIDKILKEDDEVSEEIYIKAKANLIEIYEDMIK